MILEFSKNLHLLGSDFRINDENGVFLTTLDFVKNGFTLCNLQNKLVVQAIKNKFGVNISIADSPSLFLDKDFHIKYLSIDAKEEKFILDKSFKKTSDIEFSIFGQPSFYNFKLYQKTKSDKLPLVIAEVIARPLKEEIFKAKIVDDCNVLKALAIILSVALINM